MRVICPHCQTIYQLQTDDADVVLVCHRCGTEFSLAGNTDTAHDAEPATAPGAQTPDMFAGLDPLDDKNDEAFPESLPHPTEEEPSWGAAHETSSPDSAETNEAEFSPWQDDGADTDLDDQANNEEGHLDHAAPSAEHIEAAGGVNVDAWSEKTVEELPDKPDSYQAQDLEAEDVENDEQHDDLPLAPPPRAKARIMPWLLSVLLLIAGIGFWMNHEAWLDDPWLRSVLINTGLKLDIRDKDWHVDPESVSATWLERRGGQTVLVVTGEVHNLLQTDLLPPLIHFTLYARDNPDETILERDLVITRPPLMQTIRQAPYTPPARDNTPIVALGKRGFILVLEDLPQNAGNFSLLAKAR